METDVRKRLNEFSTVELKNMIRKYNLHHRIMLSQKKDGLIDGLISHLTSEGHILTSKPTEIDLDKYSRMPMKTAKKKGYTLYRIQSIEEKVKGREVRIETPYLVENAKEGLEFNDRKVYDGRAELNRGGYYGTLGQNKELSDLVRSGKTLLTLEEIRAESMRRYAEYEAEARKKDEAKAKAKAEEAEEREQVRRENLKGNVYDVERFKDADSNSYFWANKYGDSNAYAIVKGEVKAIGVQGDWGILDSYLEPKSIPATVRFFKGKTSQSDPVVILNKAQEKRQEKQK